MDEKILIGRKEEVELLQNCYKSKEAQLIIVYGRRRVGKTFLINQTFGDDFAFKFTGVYKQSRKTLLDNFTLELSNKLNKDIKDIKDWTEAFFQLRNYLDSLPANQKQVVFFDEMPWLDTPKSGFLPAFEYFWNNYGNAKNNLVFIVAGSTSSWISNKLLNNKGGFFNRHTARIYLEPFTLKETKEYLLAKNIHWSNYDIAQLYMLIGGIPFYLNRLLPEYTLNENIDNLFFKQYGYLYDEFDRLYATLFNNDKKYISIVEALSKSRYGLVRSEIANKTKLANNGDLSVMLKNLIDSGFVSKTTIISKRKEYIYQLSDFYTLFYFHFIKENQGDEHFYSSTVDLSKRKNYLLLSFELLCKSHIRQIKKALDIYAVSSNCYSINKKGNDDEEGYQIDLVIDRRDNTADICEMKYSLTEFEIDKRYYDNLLNKINSFEKTNPMKSMRLVLVTTVGLKKNTYSNIVNKIVTLNDLFEY